MCSFSLSVTEFITASKQNGLDFPSSNTGEVILSRIETDWHDYEARCGYPHGTEDEKTFFTFFS